MKKLIIFGLGDQAELAHYFFSKDTAHAVAAFTVNREYIRSESFHDLPIIPFEEIESNFPPRTYSMFIAIGYSKTNKARSAKYAAAKNKGYELVSYISSRATIFDNVTIGDNCFILENNTIQPYASVGNNVTLWSGNHIGHHSVIGDHGFIASQVVIAGRVQIGPYCFIGINATIRDHVVIAKECVIGAGALILKNTREKEVYISEKTRPSKFTSDRLEGL